MIYAFLTGQFEIHKSWVYSVDNNKQDIVISASENELLLWNKRECIARLVGHSNAIKSVAFSHDGQHIVSGSIDKSIKVWSTSSKKIIKTLKGHSDGVNKVEFSNSDNYIISTGYENKMLIWDWTNDKIIKEFSIKHTYFSISTQDILAYVDSTCNLILFDLKSMSAIKVVGQYCGLPVFSPKNNVVAVSDINDKSLLFIDLKANKLLSTLNILKENSARELSTFEFTPDGQYIVVGLWGGDIEIWDWEQKIQNRTLHGHILSSVNDFSFNSKKQLISASGDRSLKFWDLKTGDLKLVLGDGLFQAKLIGLLSISILLNLIAGFWALTRSTEDKYSSYILLSLLTFWSLGIGLILYFFKSTLTKYATPIIWIATVLSGLFIWSAYGIWLAIFTIPISLLFCYIKMITNNDKVKIYAPLIINLIFCGILCSFVISSGLWK